MYSFKMKLTKGQKISYVSKTTIATGGMKPIEMPLTMQCTDVKGDVYTVKYSVGAIMGQKPQDITMKINSKGEIVEGKGAASQMTGMGATSLPKKPIKIGQSWTATVDSPSMGGTMKVTSTYTFKSVKNVGGRQVAEIGLKMTGSGANGMKVSGTGNLLLSMADASMAGMNLDMKTGVGGQSFDMKMVVTRK